MGAGRAGTPGLQHRTWEGQARHCSRRTGVAQPIHEWLNYPYPYLPSPPPPPHDAICCPPVAAAAPGDSDPAGLPAHLRVCVVCTSLCVWGTREGGVVRIPRGKCLCTITPLSTHTHAPWYGTSRSRVYDAPVPPLGFELSKRISQLSFGRAYRTLDVAVEGDAHERPAESTKCTMVGGGRGGERRGALGAGWGGGMLVCLYVLVSSSPHQNSPHIADALPRGGRETPSKRLSQVQATSKRHLRHVTPGAAAPGERRFGCDSLPPGTPLELVPAAAISEEATRARGSAGPGDVGQQQQLQLHPLPAGSELAVALQVPLAPAPATSGSLPSSPLQLQQRGMVSRYTETVRPQRGKAGSTLEGAPETYTLRSFSVLQPAPAAEAPAQGLGLGQGGAAGVGLQQQQQQLRQAGVPSSRPVAGASAAALPAEQGGRPGEAKPGQGQGPAVQEQQQKQPGMSHAELLRPAGACARAASRSRAPFLHQARWTLL